MDGRDAELAMDLRSRGDNGTNVVTQSPEDDISQAMTTPKDKSGDAAEMKSRSSQKTFIFVSISTVHLLLSIRMEDSFFCREARIRTRELEYRNRTLSFEELADHFIPSDPSWKGWVRMAFHQPLVPVLPVARELISKTKWVASRKRKDTKGSKKSTLALEQSPQSRPASPNKLTKRGPAGFLLKKRKALPEGETKDSNSAKLPNQYDDLPGPSSRPGGYTAS